MSLAIREDPKGEYLGDQPPGLLMFPCGDRYLDRVFPLEENRRVEGVHLPTLRSAPRPTKR